MFPAAPSLNLALLGKIAGWVIFAAIIGTGLWFWLKKSKEPSMLVLKWALTVPGLLAWYLLGAGLNKKMGGGMDIGAAIVAVVGAAVVGLYLAIIWRRNIAAVIAQPFGDVYDGGDQEIDPQAYYSKAEARRKRGQFTEAIAEIRLQLERFPTDLRGHLLLAEIHAENLNDLPGAALIIERFCQQPEHPPRNIAYALNTLADWHLKYGLDPEAAAAVLQQIVTRFPDTELALLAQQRIAHLATRDQLAARRDPAPIQVPKGIENLGLLDHSAALAPADPDQAQRANALVKHLQEHPQDTDAREQLAIIYADHYRRLDLAAEELGQLINQPHQPPARVVHWLNLLADLQLRHGGTYETVALTLSQISSRFPNHSGATLAQNRINHLRLEMKGQQTGRTVKLGTYEQDIGLKQGPPKSSH
jgi:tetratricopeptide (TPR) repeat protein